MSVLALVLGIIGIIGFGILAFVAGENTTVLYCSIFMMVIEVAAPFLLFSAAANINAGILTGWVYDVVNALSITVDVILLGVLGYLAYKYFNDDYNSYSRYNRY